MSATPDQLRAVAAALTPEAFDSRDWHMLCDLATALDTPTGLMVWQAVCHGNMALWRAVALRLELEALRLEQEARNAWRVTAMRDDRDMTVRESHAARATHGRQDASDIATVVRAHWEQEAR